MFKKQFFNLFRSQLNMNQALTHELVLLLNNCSIFVMVVQNEAKRIKARRPRLKYIFHFNGLVSIWSNGEDDDRNACFFFDKTEIVFGIDR